MTDDINYHNACIVAMLKQSRLRITRQRMSLAFLLFGSGNRHVTAETLHAEAIAAGEKISLATIYNTLRQFRQAGLLRELAIDGAKTYFDTNTSDHNHFFIEENGKLIDIEKDAIKLDGFPQPPEGMKISHIDVVIRLTKV
ncbi:MAG: iron response transcriptional regulator IrrA [Pseudomonadota bacterium]